MNLNKGIKYFSGIMFTNGFYRGWNSHYRSPYLDDNNDLLIDKIIRGTCVGFAHATWYAPVSLYQIIGRTEVKLNNQNPYNYEHLYTELFAYTTLPKKK
jgi:hypothetical protein